MLVRLQSLNSICNFKYIKYFAISQSIVKISGRNFVIKDKKIPLPNNRKGGMPIFLLISVFMRIVSCFHYVLRK